MALSTRQELIDYCLRRLGFPVIEINIDEDQINDRIDDALQFWQEYHFDGVERALFKHKITLFIFLSLTKSRFSLLMKYS